MRNLVLSLILAAAITAPSTALAEQIVHLKDGSTLRGEMVGKKDGVVAFKTSIGVIEVPEGSIVRIEYVGGATPQNVWDTPSGTAPGTAPAAPRPIPPAAGAAERPVSLLGKVGYHQYRGSGWSDLGRYEHDFDGPAGEVGGTARVSQQEAVGVDIAFGAGYYGGSTCIRDENGDCFTLSFTNIYVEGGPRLVVDAGPAFFHGQFGVGAYSSSFRASYLGESDSDSRLTPSGHFLLGGGVAATPRLRFFVEGKFTYADGKFPDATEKLDMGGLLFMTGMAIRLK